MRRWPWFVCTICLSFAGVARAAEVFIELDGFNGFWGSPGVPGDAYKRLKQVQGRNEKLKCFAFTPTGDWVFLFGGNGYYTSNQALPVCKKMSELQNQNQNQDADFQCVAFAPGGGWTLFWGGNGNWTEGNAPDDAFKRIVEVGNAGGTFRSVAYGPGGSWVLLFDKTGVSYGGIPNDLAKVLNNAVKKRVAVRCVEFIGSDWICLTDNGWWTSNLNLPASKLIGKNLKEGYSPKWIASAPILDPGARVDSLVAKAGIKANTPGAAMLVIEGGKVVLQKCYGLANVKDKRPITPQSSFELASCSKQFTGAAILILYQQGKLALDDDVRKYLPELPEYNKKNPIRIHHLAQHTSGLPDYLSFPDVKGKHPKFVSNEDYVAEFARLRKPFPLRFPTGAKSEYQNTNYMLLALIVERVVQKPFGAFLKTAIFDPLKMTGASVYEFPNVRPREPALGYQKQNGSFQDIWGPPPYRHETLLAVGDGSVWASLEDLIHWDEGWRQGKVLKPATLKLALVPSKTRDGKTNDYAYGWILTHENGKLLGMSHNGAWGGFQSIVDRNLADDRTVIVLGNLDGLDLGAIRGGVR